MTPQEAISFFGTQAKLAEQMGIYQSSVSEWVAAGSIPWPRQFQIQHLTNGALLADTEDPRPRRRKSAEYATQAA